MSVYECHHRAQQPGSWHRCHRCPSVLGVDSRTSCFHLSRRPRALLCFTLPIWLFSCLLIFSIEIRHSEINMCQWCHNPGTWHDSTPVERPGAARSQIPTALTHLKPWQQEHDGHCGQNLGTGFCKWSCYHMTALLQSWDSYLRCVGTKSSSRYMRAGKVHAHRRKCQFAGDKGKRGVSEANRAQQHKKKMSRLQRSSTKILGRERKLFWVLINRSYWYSN